MPMLSPSKVSPDSFGTASSAPWRASLDIQFTDNPHRSGETIGRHRHLGPLRIQKLLYPEGPRTCHAIIVHPPGGIAGGDDLSISLAVAAGASALITTPGATRWYGSSGPTAMQAVRLNIEGDCEWLPMETIVYDGAEVNSSIHIDCSESARMIGWDTLIFGRQAFGEDFSRGRFRQTISCYFENQLIWQERTRLTGSDTLFSSPTGLDSHRSCSTIWAIREAGASWTETDIERLRANAPSIAWSVLWPRLVVGRHMGEPLSLKANNTPAWACLRSMVFGRSAPEPRIWST